MAKMTKEEILAIDKEDARFRAAAQAFMARTLGYRADWSIYRNWPVWNDEEARYLERTWLGRVHTEGVSTPHDWLMIRLAGELAEYVKDERDLDCYEAFKHLYGLRRWDTLLEEGFEEFDTPEIERCLELLKAEMPKIQQELEETAETQGKGG